MIYELQEKISELKFGSLLLELNLTNPYQASQASDIPQVPPTKSLYKAIIMTCLFLILVAIIQAINFNIILKIFAGCYCLIIWGFSSASSERYLINSISSGHKRHITLAWFLFTLHIVPIAILMINTIYIISTI